jgi:predicted lipoprotein with Yx(FWY)xxD motif
VIKTATATVNGTAKTILTDTKGLTLYYFTPDTSTTSNCTGGCTAAWPPLLVTRANSPTSETALPGKLTAVDNTNGTQVQYNGHFLYTYTEDNAPGQTNGEGSGGKWFVATTDLS